jgi:hypothetical protein
VLVAHQPLGAAADLTRLFLEVAARTIEKALSTGTAVSPIVGFEFSLVGG